MIISSKLKTVVVAMVLVFSVVRPQPAQAQVSCDVCVTAAVLLSSSLVTSAISLVNANLFQIGRSIDSQGASIVAKLGQLTVSTEEHFKILINEQHVLQEKIQTFRSQSEVRRAYGSLSSVNCFQINSTAGMLTDTGGTADALRANIALVDSEIKATTKDEINRTALIKTNILDTDLSDYFDDDVLTPAQIDLVPVVSHLLTQHKSYPFPADPFNPNVDANSEVYRQAYRDRELQLSVANQAINEALISNVPNLAATEFTTATLLAAGLDPAQYIADGKVTEKGLITAVGLSRFGNTAGTELGTQNGDELLRSLVWDVGKTNYLLSKQYFEQKQQTLLAGLELARLVELQTNDDLAELQRNSN